MNSFQMNAVRGVKLTVAELKALCSLELPISNQQRYVVRILGGALDETSLGDVDVVRFFFFCYRSYLSVCDANLNDTDIIEISFLAVQ